MNREVREARFVLVGLLFDLLDASGGGPRLPPLPDRGMDQPLVPLVERPILSRLALGLEEVGEPKEQPEPEET